MTAMPFTPPRLYTSEAGSPHPTGTTIDKVGKGVNFSVYADGATAIALLLFDHPDALLPVQEILLNPLQNKTEGFWHVYVKELDPAERPVYYAFRADGPYDLSGKGDRYNLNKVLIDPYACGNDDRLWKRADALGPLDNVSTAMRSVLMDLADYDWEGTQPLKRPLNETIVYEMHVRGVTKSPTSGCAPADAGTFAGIIEKIPYLQELGITAVELLPVFDFDEKEVKGISPLNGQPLTNYWGYDPISYFAPQCFYCKKPERGSHVNEFRDMVKALHRAGIEVILDVVFNHTGEGNENGPTISFKGLANSTYYLLTPWDKQYYWNFSGAGNTSNANHPVTQELIIDALEYWVTQMHVDGFRFDEAAILIRDDDGNLMKYPPVPWRIALSHVLANTKVIAEVWDASNQLNLQGRFPGRRWGEWNGRYRDAVRRFVKGDSGTIEDQTIVGRLATVIAGSADIFQTNSQHPTNSINFVTCHDGFTLNDLVSYNYKHNEANGENNTDGSDNNASWNCGVEGPTNDRAIEELRERQIKNFFTILMLSQGMPMFVAGDEVRRTQQGNNNPYNQDNEISWFDWRLIDRYPHMLRFFQKMIRFRKQHSILRRNRFFDGQQNSRGLLDIVWHGCRLNSPGWFDENCHVLSFTMGGLADNHGVEDDDIHVILNMDWQDLDFDIPAVPGRRWHKVIDTSQLSPDDIADDLIGPLNGAIVEGPGTYRAKGRSTAVFVSQ